MCDLLLFQQFCNFCCKGLAQLPYASFFAAKKQNIPGSFNFNFHDRVKKKEIERNASESKTPFVFNRREGNKVKQQKQIAKKR